MFMKHYAPNRCLYIKGGGGRVRMDVNEQLKFLGKFTKQILLGGGGWEGGGR